MANIKAKAIAEKYVPVIKKEWNISHIPRGGPSCSKPLPSFKVAKRSSSTESHDSISDELRYFKPITTAPKTPPKQLPDGQFLEPRVIYAKPRKLTYSFDYANVPQWAPTMHVSKDLPTDCDSPLNLKIGLDQRCKYVSNYNTSPCGSREPGKRFESGHHQAKSISPNLTYVPQDYRKTEKVFTTTESSSNFVSKCCKSSSFDASSDIHPNGGQVRQNRIRFDSSYDQGRVLNDRKIIKNVKRARKNSVSRKKKKAEKRKGIKTAKLPQVPSENHCRSEASSSTENCNLRSQPKRSPATYSSNCCTPLFENESNCDPKRTRKHIKRTRRSQCLSHLTLDIANQVKLDYTIALQLQKLFDKELTEDFIPVKSRYQLRSRSRIFSKKIIL